MTLDRDPLVWLLPDAPRRQERAQSLVTGLRLLRSAGRGVASPSVGISGPRARHELERRSNDAHTSALEDLLRHHLGAAQDADAVLWFGWPRLSTDRAWRRLLETPRRGGTSSPEPPAPAENPLDVAERLIRGAEWAPARTAFWQARSAWVRGARQEARDLWSSLATDPEWAMEIAVDRAAAELECGHVRRALAHLGLAGVQEHPRGRRLTAWCQVALGGAPARPDALLDPAEGGPVPAGLLAWRGERGAWAGILTGPATPSGAAAQRIPIPEDREAIGAVAFGVFVLDARRGWVPLCCDLAPALESRRRAWMISRQDSWTIDGEPELRHLFPLTTTWVRSWVGCTPNGSTSSCRAGIACRPGRRAGANAFSVPAARGNRRARSGSGNPWTVRSRGNWRSSGTPSASGWDVGVGTPRPSVRRGRS